MLKNIRLILNFKTLQAGQQIIAMQILSSISRGKRKQTWGIGQLIEYNMRNIFLEKSYKKYGGEITPRLFYKRLNLSISLDHQSGYLQQKIKN